jgi:hypothetical protein
MADNPNQPREDDVVLGGQNSAPVGGVVLGGVEGVKRRLASAVEEEQITALWEALKYGDVGLGLVIQALNHESGQVRWAAYRLLRERTEPVVKSALQEYIPLNSAVRVDYSRLQELLRVGKWREADWETRTVMLKAANREQEGYLLVKSIQKFPCEDLQTINQLWLSYSNERFGFSIQTQIWQSVGGTKNANWRTYCRFAKRVGWLGQRYGNPANDSWCLPDGELSISIVPEGHLPSEWVHSKTSADSWFLAWRKGFSYIALRLDACGQHVTIKKSIN